MQSGFNGLKQKSHWVLWTVSFICVVQGLRLMVHSDSVSYLVGVGLLTPVPGFLYRGWREYRRQELLAAVASSPASERVARSPRPALDSHSA